MSSRFLPNELTAGHPCTPDGRKGIIPSQHIARDAAGDPELLAVYTWLREHVKDGQLTKAVDEAVKYVLDGARTWRFELMGSDVDSDERASVGTKLQYHVIEKLGLQKEPPLDTTIARVPVEIKGTIGDSWMIPREGQCQVTILIKVDAAKHRFQARLMRTHRLWLREGTNQDGKRSPRAPAISLYSLPVVPWTDLPPEPLRLLDAEQRMEVLSRQRGLKVRVIAMFRALPETVIPRSSILTVGAGLRDPLRRAREAKAPLRELGLVVLVGTWDSERAAAAKMGFDLSEEAWVAIPIERFAEFSIPVPDLG